MVPPGDEEGSEPVAPDGDSTVPPDADGEVSPHGAPPGTPVGAPGLGSMPYFSFEEFDLGDRSTARVNIANGNLLVESSDIAIAGPGVGIDLGRVYNGLSSLDGALGGGWDFSVPDLTATFNNQTTATFTTANGFKVEFAKNSSGVWESAPGSNLTLTEDQNQKLVVTSNQTGEKYTFGNFGHRATYTDRNGVGIDYDGNTWGDFEGMVDAAGRAVNITTYFGARTGLADSAGRTVAYSWDNENRLETVVGADGNLTTTYTYDSEGRLASISSSFSGGSQPQDLVTEFTYDAQHRVTEVREGLSGSTDRIVTGFAYSSAQTVVTDPNGNDSTFEFDNEGRVVKTIDPLDRERSQTWTSNSDVQTTTDAFASGGNAGNTTTYEYDANNNRTSATLPTGAAATAAYAQGVDCPNGGSGHPYLAKCSTDDAGNSKSYEYDAAGNPTKVTNSTAGAVEHEYTYETSDRTVCGGFAGQVCTAKDGNGNVTAYSYDVDGNLATVTPPAPLGTTTYAYDSIGRVTSVTDGNGDTTGYAYDVFDRLVKTTYENNDEQHVSYRGNGDVADEWDNAGRERRSFFDAYGRTDSYFMDLYGESLVQQTQLNLDATGNLVAFRDPQVGQHVFYGYDAANQLTSVRDNDGVCPTSGAPTAGSECVLFEYDLNGAETKRIFPGGAAQETQRDASGRPTRITAKDSGGTVGVDIGYSYSAGTASPANDRSNVQTRFSAVEEGVSADTTTQYVYDSYNRLTQASSSAGFPGIGIMYKQWTYDYDNAGNRIQQVQRGLPSHPTTTIDYTYNAAHQLVSTTTDVASWEYDAAGNQTANGTTGATFDYGDRLQVTAIGSTPVTSFGQGNTEQLTIGNDRTFRTMPIGLTRETNGAGSVSYIRTADNDPVGYAKGISEYYYAKDHLGSVVGIFSETGAFEGGYSYSPYGETQATGTSTAVTDNRLRYIGGYQESDNVYKLGARYYDATIGRFTQMDPSGQEAHPYSYAACNPINAKDPTGTDCAGAIFTLVLGSVSLAASTIGLIVGAPTLFLGAVAAIGFIASVTGVVYSVGDIINSCG
ncbi:RHS repeat-associated core domain-containing protein [Okibacterium endophyticum]